MKAICLIQLLGLFAFASSKQFDEENPTKAGCEITPEFENTLIWVLANAQASITRNAVVGVHFHPSLMQFSPTNICLKDSEACDQAINSVNQLIKTHMQILHGLPVAVVRTPEDLPRETAKLQEFLSQLTELLKSFWLEENGGFLPELVDNRRVGYLNAVDTKLAEVESMRGRVEDDRIGRLVALLSPTSLGEAENYFYVLNNNSFIPMVMERLYPKDVNGMIVAGFTLHLMRTSSQRLIAYQKWFDLILSTPGDLVSNKALVLRKCLEVEIAGAGPTPDPILVEMKGKTDIYKDAMISNWARQVANGDFDQVMEFANIPNSETVGDMFDELLPQLVERVYGTNPDNMLAVMEFILSLKFDIHKCTGLDKMLELVSPSGEDLTMVVAARIKETMDQLDPSSVAKEKFDQLKARMPQIYRDLMWHSVCRIRMYEPIDDYLQPLFADFDRAGRRLFTWAVKDDTGKGESERFRLPYQITQDGKQVHFNLESLFDSVDGKFAALDGPVANQPFGFYVNMKCAMQSYNWKVESVSGNDVRIKHLGTNSGYLTASTLLDGSSRTVVVWTHPVITPTEYVWNLSCSEN